MQEDRHIPEHKQEQQHAQKINSIIERNIMVERSTQNGSMLELTAAGHIIAEYLRGIESLIN